MKIKNLKNSSALLTVTACFVFTITLPNLSHAQGYNPDAVELEALELEMPEPSSNTIDAVDPMAIKEATSSDLMEVSESSNTEGVVQGQVMEAVNVESPSQSTLEAEVTGLTENPVQPNSVEEDPNDNNDYFDSFSGNDDLTGSDTPRRVDPRFEPGSKFIVVRQDASETSQQAIMTAANRALSLGRYASALEMFERMHKRNPRDKNVMMGLAIAQQNMGFTESAIATYQSLIRVDPKNVDAKVNLLGLLKHQDPQQAHHELMHLWEHYPRDAGIAAQIGLVSAEMGKTDDAVRFLGIASSLEPTNALHIYNMAVIYDRAGANNDALKLYEQALQIDASSSSHSMLQRETVYDRLAKLRRL